MTDVHTPEQRSLNMSRIRGKDTKPEMLVRKFLFSQGLRYRLHDPKLPGKPDLVLRGSRIQSFPDGYSLKEGGRQIGNAVPQGLKQAA